MAMPTKTSTPRNDHVFQMDTYSSTIGIDNRCTLRILHIAEDFLVTLENQEEISEVLEELSNPKSRLGLSYGDGRMTKDNNISS